MKKIITLLSLSFLLLSCGTEEKEEQTNVSVKTYNETQNSAQESIEIKEETKKYSPQIKDIPVEYDEKKEELSVGNILIKKGFPQGLEKSILQYKDEETYINSNVKNYFFFSSEDHKDGILGLYRSNLKQNGWEEVQQELPEWGEANSNMLEMTKAENKIQIIISENIPENLSYLNLSWEFIEVYYE